MVAFCIELPSGLSSIMRLPADNTEESARGLLGSVESDSCDASGTYGPDSEGKATPGGLTNGHNHSFVNGNGISAAEAVSSRKLKHPYRTGEEAGSSADRIQRVNLPGTRLYDDSCIDREEFIRLVIQSLKDVGYMYV